MDASQYKDYILVLLFVKYISDKYGGREDSLSKVPKGGSFQNMVELKGKPEIGEGINKIIARLAEENELKGVIDVADFNDSDKLGKGKDMQDRLSNQLQFFSSETAVMDAYNQAISEGLTPSEAKNLLLTHVKSLSSRTIYTYLPDEAKDKVMQQLRLKKSSLQICNEPIDTPTEDIPNIHVESFKEQSTKQESQPESINDSPSKILLFHLSIPYNELSQHMANEFKVHKGMEPIIISGKINKLTEKVTACYLEKYTK